MVAVMDLQDLHLGHLDDFLNVRSLCNVDLDNLDDILDVLDLRHVDLFCSWICGT